MQIYRQNGLYGEGDVIVFETFEDFAEYEALPDFNKREPNADSPTGAYQYFKNHFSEYVGYQVLDCDVIYDVVGVECNDAWADWYWILKNTETDEIIYELSMTDYKRL